MYKLYFYVPENNLESVKEKLFKSGAGKIGEYRKCSWQTKGNGQFLPGVNSDPQIGERGKAKKLEEYKVEMVLQESIARKVVNTLLKVHPYEEPAYGLIKIFKSENL